MGDGGLKARLYHNPFSSPLGSWAEARFRRPGKTQFSRYQQSAHPSELILESTIAEGSIRTSMPAMDTTRARVEAEVGLYLLSPAPHIDSSFVIYSARKRRPSSRFDSISSPSQRERKSSNRLHQTI